MALLKTATALLGATALGAGCGGEAAEVATTTVIATTTVEVTVTTSDTPPAELTFEGFESPSGNIGCVAHLGGGLEPRMRCTITELANEPPPRPASCEFDWGNYFELAPTGAGAWACVSDAMVPDDGYVTLEYGGVWKRGPFTCRARPTGVRCTNPEGHGLFLSSQRQSVF